MNRAFPAALILLSAAAPGCDGDSPSEPASLPVSSQDRQEVPFKESYEATGTIAPSSTCPAGTLQVLLDGGGTGSHVGRYTITNSHCLDLATGAFTSGSFVKTAANGDQLFGTYSGVGTVVVPPNPVGEFEVNGTLVFTGGTGRFAGATGTLSMRGTQVSDFSQSGFPTEIRLTLEGTISPVGSAR